ncbi:NAD(P)/FAD-dependent oxidoreductase [Candidatus Dependentiae bacterium]|nr:NAD(P)/FAD-dependent oxidoreductase [Candidatus Dependentiae bacterium]
MGKKIVVIGAGAASMAFMTKLRSFDAKSEIICFSAESYFPYNRCLLADYLNEAVTLQQIYLKSEIFFKESAIDLRIGVAVTSIDRLNKKVITGVESFDYDYLFLGMGSRSVFSSLSLSDFVKERVFSFHTLADAERLLLFIKNQKPQKMVVIGAGLNGIEAAAALRVHGIEILLVDRASQILSTQVDQEVALFVEKILCDHGVAVLLNHFLLEITEKSNQKIVLHFDKNLELEVDGIVFAIGSKVNNTLIADTKIDTLNNSILVDAAMKTSDDSIYAGGDICMVPDIITQQRVQSLTWSDAMLQGLCAATQLSSQPRSYPGAIGLRNSSWFGYDFYACAMTKLENDDNDYQIEVDIQSKSLRKCYIKDGILKGFVLIGDCSALSFYKQWYMTQKKDLDKC